MAINIARRKFIAALGGTTLAWPLVARAQQADRMRRIGVLTHMAADDPDGKARLAAFVQGLQERGWTDGRNVRIDYRWAAGDADRYRTYAAELVALAPDVILASTSASVAALRQTTRTVPIVFAIVIDPVGAGLVASLARPGGNATGFTLFEYSLSGKWLELLKEIAPNLTRIAILRDPAVATGIGQFAAIQAMAPPSFGVELSPIDVRDAGEIERDVAAFARGSNGGLIVTAFVGARGAGPVDVGKSDDEVVYALDWHACSACVISMRYFCMSHAPVGQRSAHSPQCRHTSSSLIMTRPVLRLLPI